MAGYATMNASFLCNSAKLLVTPRKWKGRVPFIRHLQDFLARVPTRPAYYPGAEERWHEFIKGEYRLRTFGGSGGGVDLPQRRGSREPHRSAGDGPGSGLGLLQRFSDPERRETS